MENNKNLFDVINKLVRLNIFLIFIIFLLVIFVFIYTKPLISLEEKTLSANFINQKIENTIQAPKEEFWKEPDISSAFDSNEQKKLQYGFDLIVHTSNYFGPNGTVKKNATNGMNCQNCHLDAGTKIYGNNYSAVASTYPKYRARSGSTENLYKRVNDCFERSLNGNPLNEKSLEMQSILAYINFLGKDVPKGEKPNGSGFKDLAFLERACNPENGKLVYQQKCQSCHQKNGEGQLTEDKNSYQYPPLWGNNSYNDGAGLYRISNFAKYVKYNMPLGVSYDNTQLTDEESWDVAAFVNSMPRPKKNISKDWPNVNEKPFDHPFGPFVDGFDEKQHKYGPYKPIQTKLKELNKSKKS
ncbi:MAG: c-type cytochrome [Bacteroidota bacterium]